MAWLLVIVTCLLALLLVLVALLMLRVRRLEQLADPSPSSDADRSSAGPDNSHSASLDESDRPDYVITHVGEVPDEPVPAVTPRLFADIVLRESVIWSAGLFHGLRRALAAESRNRIRFEMRREVKRSRKQRRADLREARREWEARQRASLAMEDTAA